VVGVVGDVRQDGLGSQPKPEIYRPYAQEPGRSFTVVLRTVAEAESLAAAARETVRRVHPAVPVSNVQVMESVIAASMGRPRLTAAVLALFAILALLLAMVGVYGTVSHSVARRTREFGVRIALGAPRGDLRRLILREELLPLVVGLAAGLVASRALAHVMTSIVFGVSPTDPTTVAAAAALLLVAAVLACAVPAQRAATIDPLTALRSR
jgi:ABC-type antimicrobial peptide transport system permease subunit